MSDDYITPLVEPYNSCNIMVEGAFIEGCKDPDDVMIGCLSIIRDVCMSRDIEYQEDMVKQLHGLAKLLTMVDK